MEKVPTAKEFVLENADRFQSTSPDEWMIEFAKLHVQAALKAASEKATVTPIDHEKISEGSFRPIWGVDDDSILNSYPPENIK